MNEDVLTIKEVAILLKVKRVTIYKLLAEKRIPGIKISGAWRFRRSLIEQWIDVDCFYYKNNVELEAVAK